MADGQGRGPLTRFDCARSLALREAPIADDHREEESVLEMYKSAMGIWAAGPGTSPRLHSGQGAMKVTPGIRATSSMSSSYSSVRWSIIAASQPGRSTSSSTSSSSA